MPCVQLIDPAIKDHRGGIRISFACVRDILDQAPTVDVLCPEERKRMATYRQQGDQVRFLASRLLLRHALSSMSGGELPPVDWRFALNPHGKPAVIKGQPQLPFSLSHAGHGVAVAVGGTASGDIGVDLEMIDGSKPVAPINDVLTPSEQTGLARLPDNRVAEEFIKLWTVKEACAKAFGLGASIDFRVFEVRKDPLNVQCSSDLLPSDKRLCVHSQMIRFDEIPYHMSAVSLCEQNHRPSFSIQRVTRLYEENLIG